MALLPEGRSRNSQGLLSKSHNHYFKNTQLEGSKIRIIVERNERHHLKFAMIATFPRRSGSAASRFLCCSIACLQIRNSPHLPRGVPESEPVLHRPEGTGPLLADVSVLLEAIPAGAPPSRGGRKRRRLRGDGDLKGNRFCKVCQKLLFWIGFFSIKLRCCSLFNNHKKSLFRNLHVGIIITQGEPSKNNNKTSYLLSLLLCPVSSCDWHLHFLPLPLLSPPLSAAAAQPLVRGWDRGRGRRRRRRRRGRRATGAGTCVAASNEQNNSISLFQSSKKIE